METAPIELTLYDNDDKVIGTLSRARIPSYLLDIAIELQSKLTQDEQVPQNTDALFDFIVEFYGNKITRDQLKQQTDLIECMTVLRSVLARASGLALEFAQANPRVPSPKKK
jgi:hypothetical protein